MSTTRNGVAVLWLTGVIYAAMPCLGAVPAPAPKGACCTGTGCVRVTQLNCSGLYMGNGTFCDTNDCDGDGSPNACELAFGVGDCNKNGIPDNCDITSGTSNDCDGNSVPDECEFVDCNCNSSADRCDIAEGSSEDCNDNGVPDECDADCDGDSIPDSCDIVQGTPDCNANGTPDNCEPDCNANGITDQCDITSGAPDCNGNGVPDACEPGDCDNDSILNVCEIANGAADADNNTVPDACQAVLLVPSQFATIQAALNQVQDGDEIRLAPGTYPPAVGFNGLVDNGKIFSITGGSGPMPTIDLPSNARFMLFTQSDWRTRITGIKFRNGNMGVLWIEDSSPTIINCVFQNNFAENGGAITIIDNSEPVIEDCQFNFNRARWRGGAVYSVGTAPGGPTFRNTNFIGNAVGLLSGAAGLTGGAVYCWNSDLTMVDCGLSQNNAPSAEGGALYIGPGNSSLLDCEVSGNWAQKGGGIRTKSAKLDIFDSFIHGNTAQFGSGGGMYIELGHTRLESSQVGFNVADQDQAASAPQGGGIHAIGSICPAAASLTIRNTIIGGNQADGTPPDISTGGGLFGLHMPVTLTGCTLALNFADEGGGMHLTSSVPIRPAELRNTIFWSNSAATGVGMQVRAANGYAVNVNFCDVQGGSAGISVGGTSTLNFGVGNLNVNPQFEQPAGQFGILPGSPCINLGDPAFVPQPGETDFEGDTRLLYGRVDVGADEETGQ